MKNIHYLKYYLVTIVFILMYQIPSFSQSSPTPVSTTLPSVIPPTPTPANLGSFGVSNISLYTGTPQINIPITSIPCGNYLIPLSLNYKSGGVKVNEIASWVGLGWNLNAGGCITRSQNGLPDESVYGYQNTPVDIKPLSFNEKHIYARGIKDCELDQFFFSFPNHSGSFIINKNKEILTTNEEEIEIEIVETGNISFIDVANGICEKIPLLIKSWKIIDENGNEYFFDIIEKTVSWGRFYENAGSNFGYNVESTATNPAINTWYLSKIVTSEKYEINFLYIDEDYEYDLPGETKKFILDEDQSSMPAWIYGESFPDISLSSQRLFVKAKRLSMIDTPEIIINFEASNSRADLIGSNYLKKIQIQNKISNKIVRDFNFTYKYLLNNSLIDCESITPTGSNLYNIPAQYPISFSYRLMLSKVEEKNEDKSLVHNLEYFHNIGLPNRASIWRDHWGFSNGPEIDPYRLVHPFSYNHLNPNLSVVPEKDCDFSYAVQGSLKKIIYPTGGFTEINYESNECTSEYLPNPFRTKPELELFINYGNYSGMEYPTEIKSVEFNGVPTDVICQYIEFTIDDLRGKNTIELNLNNYPQLLSAVSPRIGFFISKISAIPEQVVWNINQNLLEFSTSNFNCDYQNSHFETIYTGSTSITLFNGTYRLYHYNVDDPPTNPLIFNCPYLYSYSLRIKSFKEQYYSLVKKVGGLRTESILNYSEPNKLAKKIKYDYSNETISYSGIIVNFPSYVRKNTFRFAHNVSGLGTSYWDVIFRIQSTDTDYPLLSTQGSPIGYSAVIERITDLSNGLNNGNTTYTYTSPGWYPDLNYLGSSATINPNIFPYPPYTMYDFFRGKLLTKTVRDAANEIVETTTNTYENNTQSIKGQKIDYFMKSGDPQDIPLEVLCADLNNVGVEPFTIVDYNFAIGKSLLKTSTHTLKTTQGEITNETENSYRGSRIIQSTESTSEPGKDIVINYKYCDDKLGNPIYYDLNEKNMINEVVEYQKSLNGTQNLEHYRINYDYSNLNKEIIVKRSIEEKIGESSFNIKINYNQHTENHGKPTDFALQDGIPNSVLWSSNEVNPIAEIKNATTSECGYAGFERTELNGWTLQSSGFEFISDPLNVWTGIFSLKLSSNSLYKTISIGSNANNHSGYKASVWVKGPTSAYIKIAIAGTNEFVRIYNPEGANDWHLLVAEIPYAKYKYSINDNLKLIAEIGSATGAYFDDIRFYPMDAQMTTYTYEPLIGVTSVSDINSKPTIYEYDGLGRLVLVRDFLGDILKKYDYNYK